MMRWVKIEDVGDIEFLVDEQTDKFRFLEENERVITAGGRPAQGRPLLLGITKASLSTESSSLSPCHTAPQSRAPMMIPAPRCITPPRGAASALLS
jgi:hypothetical protein